MDPRRRQAALYFLRNISLDGQPPQGAGQGVSGVVVRSEVTTPTPQNHSSIITAIVHSGAEEPNESDDASESQMEGDSDSRSHLHPLSDAVKGRLAPGPQRSLSGSIRKQTHTSTDSPGKSSLELQRARRRLALQRFETLPDIDENAPLQRCSSSSPRLKSSKRVHFIKNMRQYDTSDGRIILISIRRALCCAFSLLPYRDYSHPSDVTLERRHQHPSGAVATREMVIGLEGVEIGAKDKTVSYTQLLYPTHALSRHCPMAQRRSSGPFYPAAPRGFRPMWSIDTQHKENIAGADSRDCSDYDPNLLDDPHWPCGKHKRVLAFPSYMTTVIEYTKPSDLKRDMNETFREKFPHIQLTLSKIRSLKTEIRKLSQEDCGYEEPTIAMAFVYFEKLALRGKLDKENRKLCAGACILLAAKIGSDLKRFEVKQLIDRLEERLRLNRRELLAFEFPVLVALEFNLYLSDQELLPHYRRLLQTA